MVLAPSAAFAGLNTFKCTLQIEDSSSGDLFSTWCILKVAVRCKRE
jgi:hypothetical protein